MLASEVMVRQEKDRWWQTADNATKWAQENEKKYLQAIEERDKWWQTADDTTKWAQENEKKYLQAIEARNKWVQENEKLTENIRLLNQVSEQYNAIINSTSWKVTKPLRFVLKNIKSILGRKKKCVLSLIYKVDKVQEVNIEA